MFTGSYEDGKPNGKGSYKWANGANYFGDFVDGLK
jgi:hypothetical protein